MQNQVLIVENLKPLEVYNSGNIDTILEKIASDARLQTVDISTEKGRKECASLAYKIAQSKTFLDKMGKALGDDARKQIDTLNAERKKCVDFLDKLKDEIRGPLNEWETKEADRVEEHENILANIHNRGVHCEITWQSIGSEGLRQKLSETESFSRDWQEFETRAKSTLADSVSKIKQALDRSIKYENEQAELARFREAEALRIQKERDEKIAKEAAESARLEAESKAKREADLREQEVERQRLESECKAAAIELIIASFFIN